MASWKGSGHSRALCLEKEVSPKRVRLQAEVHLCTFLTWKTGAVDRVCASQWWFVDGDSYYR